MKIIHKHQISVTGNILRPLGLDTVGAHDVDISWFFYLLRPALASLMGRENVELFISKDASVESIYRDLGLSLDAYSYAKIHDDHEQYHEVLSKHLSEFNGRTIIGFELPPIIKHYLDRSGGIYIDFRISPIRFCHDLILSATSNSNQIYEKLVEYRIADENFFTAADYIKAAMTHLPAIDLIKDSAIFVGQKMFDTALIKDKTFVDESCFINQILKTARNCRAVYYKPHPYKNVKSEKILYSELSKVANISYTSENIYKLLSYCEDAHCELYGMTSSVLDEAKYFGVTAHRGIPLENTIIPDISTYIALGNAPLTTKFWSQLLEMNIAGSGIAAPPEGILKRTLGLSWGMADLTK